MGLRRGIKPMESEHVNVTPLIDVVMCLIIFFLLVGHIAKKAAVKGVLLPHAKNGADLADKSGEVIINVVPRHSDTTGVQHAPKIIVWGQDVGYDQLKAELRKYKASNPNLKLVIRADKSTHFKYIAPVLEDCASAGISSIHFMTKRPNS
ncbi:MAG: biopolymer transporter ExbD [Phycisphaerales bacterium]|nr:biopolymer transporter ExbD [Phycisphaerales bacterium]